MKTYEKTEEGFIHTSKDGVCQLTNFTAEIKEQRVFHDGSKIKTILVIEGGLRGDPLQEIEVDASDFPAMGWVAEQWGMAPIIFPAPSCERHLRTAIQMESSPGTTHIYTATGWAEIDGRRTFLTASGGISSEGLDEGLRVQLPTELGLYSLPAPKKSKEAFLASLATLDVAPAATTAVLLLATYRSAIGPSDFAVHLAGRTGTFKSEVSSLMQSHFGASMDARKLPASWSSTPNALEHLAYRAKDCLMVLDDFVPLGTAWQVRQLQKSADQIIRAQGNQAGRSRLTDVSSLQTTYYPRGIILSTGEDTPEGHSVRARMMIVELAPGEVNLKKLSASQASRPKLAEAMADWVQWLAARDRTAEMKAAVIKHRDSALSIGHARTPPIIGELAATADLLATYAQEQAFLSEVDAKKLRTNLKRAVLETASKQADFLDAADPCEGFCETIRQMLATNVGHLKTRNGGVPENADRLGWTVQQAQGEMATYKSNGPRIGWTDADHNELLIDPATMPLIKRAGGAKVAITPQTLLKRMKEGGILTRIDDARQRNTVRVTCEGHPRNVLCLSMDQLRDE
jgi:hypothetical protein